MTKKQINDLAEHIQNNEITLVCAGMIIRDLTNQINIGKPKHVIDYVNTFKLRVLNEDTFNFCNEFWYNN